MPALPVPLVSQTTAVHAMGLVSIDNTLFVQMGIFFVLLFALRSLLFKPFLETIRLREERTAGARAEADRMRTDAEEAKTQYEQAITEARTEAAEARRQLRDSGSEQKNALVDEARQKTSVLLEESGRELDAAVDLARQRIEESADRLADHIVVRLIGKAAIVIALVVPASAWAGGGGEATSDLGWLKDAFFLAVNLSVLLWLGVKFGRTPIKEALVARKDEVTRELQEAARLREEASALLTEYKARLEELEAEREALLAEFVEHGEAEKARLIAEGRSRAERLEEEAGRAIERQIRRAHMEFETRVLDQAVAKATARLKDRVQAPDQEALVHEFVDKLRALPGGQS